jgi:hypothetical protein
VETDINITCLINGYGIHGTNINTLPTADAELATDGHPTTWPLSQTTGGADRNTGCWITGKATLGKKSRRKPPRTLNTDACGLPGKPFIDQTGAGQRTGMTANTTIHMRGCKNFHKRHPVNIHTPLLNNQYSSAKMSEQFEND